MTIDVVDLREFYATPLGMRAQASMIKAVEKYGGLSRDTADISFVGIGYPLPVFDSALFGTVPNGDTTGNSANALPKTIALMPSRQGAVRWPLNEPSRTALVDENELPLETASVECVILLHLLENVSDPAAMLNEVWRVLVPEGRLILIATNRRGLWARFEHTPFGNGRPFSRGQLGTLLRKAKLTPARWGDCLNFPPMRINRMMKLYPYIEKIAHRVWPVFCGAYVVTATKRLYQGVSSVEKERKRVAVPVLAPQSARASSGRTEARD